MSATGADDATDEVKSDEVAEDATLDDAMLEATAATEDAALATLDDIAIDDALDVVVLAELLLPPQPVSTIATQATKPKVIKLGKCIRSSPTLKTFQVDRIAIRRSL